jgi:uncharacterized membrane protein
MAHLVAVGYDDEVTAAQAGAEVRRLADELVIEPDAVAVIVRDKEGKYLWRLARSSVGSWPRWRGPASTRSSRTGFEAC